MVLPVLETLVENGRINAHFIESNILRRIFDIWSTTKITNQKFFYFLGLSLLFLKLVKKLIAGRKLTL